MPDKNRGIYVLKFLPSIEIGYGHVYGFSGVSDPARLTTEAICEGNEYDGIKAITNVGITNNIRVLSNRPAVTTLFCDKLLKKMKDRQRDGKIIFSEVPYNYAGSFSFDIRILSDFDQERYSDSCFDCYRLKDGTVHAGFFNREGEPEIETIKPEEPEQIGLPLSTSEIQQPYYDPDDETEEDIAKNKRSLTAARTE